MTIAMATPDEVTEKHRPYTPFGAAAELMRRRDPEILLSGPSGTGKSRSALEKLHLAATKYPGMRGLIVRKTRESLTESALVTFEEKVVPPGHPVLNGPRRNQRQVYLYPNGSSIVVGGMRQSGKDMTQKVMSTEYDIIFAQEAIEFAEDEWERLTTRLRNAKMPYHQLIGDTNPDAPTHWLKRRCDRGQTVLLESRHEDNPACTPDYIAKLDRLTGARYHRLRWGRWVQAEGCVYEGFDAAVHVIDRFDIPLWPRYWVIDFGFTAPFCCQWWAADPDGRLFLYRELYRTQRLVEDHARDILRLSGWALQGGLARPEFGAEPRPRAIICDHDAEGRATLRKYLGLDTVAAKKELSPGIQAVAARFRKAGDGRPRLFLFRDALVERDSLLDEVKKPCGLIEELPAYVWNTTNSRKHGEEPLAQDDHACDCLRYVVYHLDAPGRPVVNAVPMWHGGNFDRYFHRANTELEAPGGGVGTVANCYGKGDWRRGV
jgi:phage terminase large subunit